MSKASPLAAGTLGIGAITLFVADLDAARRFYRDVFGLPVHFEDDASAVFKFGDTLVNLLRATDAKDLIEPAIVAYAEAGARMQLTIEVDDVDATCAEVVSVSVPSAARDPARAVELVAGQEAEARA